MKKKLNQLDKIWIKVIWRDQQKRQQDWKVISPLPSLYMCAKPHSVQSKSVNSLCSPGRCILASLQDGLFVRQSVNPMVCPSPFRVFRLLFPQYEDASLALWASPSINWLYGSLDRRALEDRLLGDQRCLPINGIFWPIYQLALRKTWLTGSKGPQKPVY